MTGLLADWIEARATLATSPVINLTDRDTAPNWNDVWGGSGERIVSYVLRSLALGQREAGVGIINLSSMQLNRFRPLVTWSGSVYTRPATTFLAFGDDVIAMCAPIAENWPLATAFMVQSEGAACVLANTVGLSTLLLTTQRAYYVPFWWSGVGQINQWALRVATASTSGQAKGAVHQVGTDGGPGPQLFTFDNQVSTTGAAGFKTAVQSARVALEPGWVYVAFITSGTPTISTMMTPQCGPAAGVAYFYYAGSYNGGLPATVPALTVVAAATRPTFLMRIANT